MTITVISADSSSGASTSAASSSRRSATASRMRDRRQRADRRRAEGADDGVAGGLDGHRRAAGLRRHRAAPAPRRRPAPRCCAPPPSAAPAPGRARPAAASRARDPAGCRPASPARPPATVRSWSSCIGRNRISAAIGGQHRRVGRAPPARAGRRRSPPAGGRPAASAEPRSISASAVSALRRGCRRPWAAAAAARGAWLVCRISAASAISASFCGLVVRARSC